MTDGRAADALVASKVAATVTFSATEQLRRADEITGLSGEELKAFHSAFLRGLLSFGPDVDIRDDVAETRARAELVAEDLLGPEKGQAYVDALLGVPDDEQRRRSLELGRRYLDSRLGGRDPEAAARAAGITDDRETSSRPNEDQRPPAEDANVNK